jgi:diguanylate cyclase (GGDEF)-like protein/putative nucleotidyltransferase with HDIG domain
MRTFSQLRPTARAYVATVISVGLAVVLHSVFALYRNPIGPAWLVLAGLTLLTGSFTIKVPGITARLTVSETFVFASVLLFGVAAGTLIVVLENLVVALWVKRESRSAYRALFNIAASAFSIWVAATTFFAVSGIQPFLKHDTPLGVPFGPLAILTIVFFLLNSWLVAIAVGLEKQKSAVEIWWKNFTWLSINYFSGASVAAVIVTYTSTLDSRALFGTLVIIVPLLLVSYLTFRTAMGRVEDTNQHLGQLNRLYLSTIETLAMAIDAKDQVTHGHIRRVQAHATSLAKEVGVRDENLLKAIEAAALLHDMGKLAVPEHILNKPGKLTEAEFEKMKLHASVGADILSAIDFPYPVVPIVRHHHENWDGTGYPAGIRATAIPIGARILAVVDCFDALTSDRPYRPRLPDSEALAILRARRGTMYDPMIVDAFLKVHSQAPAEGQRQGPRTDVLNTIVRSRRATSAHSSATPAKIRDGADELLTMYELARALAAQVGLGDAGDVIAKYLRRLIPASLCVFYVYDSSSDELAARHVVGDGELILRGTRIGLGQRLSGWVAANRETICNSDAALDLGEAARSLTPPLRTCLSTPLLFDDALIGVLSLYSIEQDRFNNDHIRVIEMIAKQVAQVFKGATEFESVAKRDKLTGLPNLAELEHLVEATGAKYPATHSSFSLLYIDVIGLEGINSLHGRAVGDDTLLHVVRQAMTGLRFADTLFRGGSDEFVALLNDTDAASALQVGNRIRQAVRSSPLLRGDTSIQVDVLTIPIPFPSDWDSFPVIIEAARARLSDARLKQRASILPSAS